MHNQDFEKILLRQVIFYYQVLKENWNETSEYNEKRKERERQRRYRDEVDHFLGLKP
ncbi:MAG: hypothetical protein JSV04_00430 [Candidatus Heimdallarchaeota archaeon]|nr:MAG: hypothetical protein JSV04_00430 [Candidatus Heimdallarchaeota archaeon]